MICTTNITGVDSFVKFIEINNCAYKEAKKIILMDMKKYFIIGKVSK